MVPIQNDQQFLRWIRDNAIITTLRKEFLAGVPIVAGTGVYMNTDGKVYPYNGNPDTYLGVAEKDSAVNCKFIVIYSGYLHIAGRDTWSAGIPYYMNNGGGITTSGDFKMALGVEAEGIVIFPPSTGGTVVSTDGYAKMLMLLGG